MSSGTMADHLANAQRTHDGAPIRWTTPNHFNVLRSATKPFQLASKTKYLIESCGVSYTCPLGIFPPCPSQHVGSKHNARGSGIGVGLGSIAIFRPCQDRKSDGSQRPASAFVVIAKQDDRFVGTFLAKLYKFRALAGGGQQEGNGSLAPYWLRVVQPLTGFYGE